MVLLFDRDAVVPAFVYQSTRLQCVEGRSLVDSTFVATTEALGNAPTRFLSSVFSIMKPQDRPLGIVPSV
jgi:hypothetical protein